MIQQRRPPRFRLRTKPLTVDPGAWPAITAARVALSPTMRILSSPTSELSDKILEYAERNVATAFEFAQRLVQVRDVQNLTKLQTDFIQVQMQAMTEQARDLSETATKAVMDSAKAPTDGGPSS